MKNKKNIPPKKAISEQKIVPVEKLLENKEQSPRFKDFAKWLSWYFITPFTNLSKTGSERFAALPRGIFSVLAVVLFFVMPFLSLDAGHSGDEHYHYEHAAYVNNWYATAGEDTTAVAVNPRWPARNYGQAFDNLTALVNHTFGIEEEFQMRHIMNSLVGWLIILFAGLTAVFFAGYRAGILAMLLLFLSPAFLGHTFNNLKDIPYAFATIFSLYHIFKLVGELPRITPYRIAMNALGIGFAIAVRAGGLLQIPYLFMFVNVFFLFTKSYQPLFRKNNFDKILKINLYLLLITALGWIVGILYWPYALQAPIKNVIGSLQAMTHFAENIRQLFEGQNQWSAYLPWYYLPKYILMTSPLLILAGIALFGVLLKPIVKRIKMYWVFILIFAALFPVAYIIYQKSNVYGGWRHVLFVYPLLICMAAIAIDTLIALCKNKIMKWAIVGVAAVLAYFPLRHIIVNHPHEYVYFNKLSGGMDKAFGNYELDYYYHSTREASEWILADVKKNGPPDNTRKTIVATWHPPSVEYYFRRDTATAFEIRFSRWYDRGNNDWDYAIFTVTGMNADLLKNPQAFPPKNTVYQVKVDGKPICIVLKRTDKSDYYGNLLKNQGQPDSALVLLKKSLDFVPTDESVLLNLSDIYLSKNMLDSAMVYWNQLLSFDPKNENANMYKANVLMYQNKLSEALQCLQIIIERNPLNETAPWMAARIYASQGNLTLMEKMIELTLIANPGKQQEALNFMRQVYPQMNLTANDANMAFTRIWIRVLEKLGYKEEAEELRTMN